MILSKVKKLSALFLIPVLAFNMGNMKVSAAADTTNVEVSVTFGQAEARTIVDMVNEFRTGSDTWYWNEDNSTKTTLTGLNTLAYDKTLEQVAMQRAAELALSYSHTRPNGTSCFTAFSESGYSGMISGENIAAGYTSAQDVFMGWREDDEDYNGQGHRRNMLNADFTAIGLGHAYYNGTHYWAMELGNTNSEGNTGVDGVQTATVEVLNSYFTSLSAAQDSYTVAVGSEQELPAVNATVQAGSTVTCKAVNLAWAVGDTSIATISDGKVIGQSLGSTTLTASAGNASATITLEVTDDGQGGDDTNNGDTNNGDTNNDDTNNDDTNNDDTNNNVDDSVSDNIPGTDNNNNNNNNNNGSNGSGSGDNNGNGSSSSGSNSSSGKSSSSKSSGSNSGQSQATAVAVPFTSSVNGVRTTTGGAYLATSVNGSIVITPAADICTSYGLAKNEKPFCKFYNFDAKKSPLAKATIDSAAAEQKATVGPMLNIELGKMSGGKYSLLPADGSAIRISLGIPKHFVQADKTYAVICVNDGGTYSILKDLDSNLNTITFDTKGGAGVYVIIKY